MHDQVVDVMTQLSLLTDEERRELADVRWSKAIAAFINVVWLVGDLK